MYVATASADGRLAGPIGDSAQAAVEWIHQHYRDYMDAGRRILLLRGRALGVQFEAEDAGDLERQRAAARLVESIDDLYGRWSWSSRQMRWVAARIPGVGLSAWVVPVLVSSVALVVAGVGATVMYQLKQREKALEMIERGTLSVDEARALGLDLGTPFVQITPGVGLAALAAAGAYVWWRRGQA